jgi:hypothetical protein
MDVVVRNEHTCHRRKLRSACYMVSFYFTSLSVLYCGRMIAGLEVPTWLWGVMTHSLGGQCYLCLHDRRVTQASNQENAGTNQKILLALLP